jgi:predicted GTPase
VSQNLLLGTRSPHLMPFCEYSLTPKQQRWHGLIVGKSGAGKSKLLQQFM